jgi:hypothetical protein
MSRLKLGIAVTASVLTINAISIAGEQWVSDVSKVVQGIVGDRAKLTAYCDMVKLNAEATQAFERNDLKAFEDISMKQKRLWDALGPDYAKLMRRLSEVDLEPGDAKVMTAAFAMLDKQCR